MAPLVTTPWNPSMIQNAFNSVQTNGKVPMGPTMTRKAQEAYENRVAYLNELPDSGFDINTIMAPRINQFNQTHDQSAKDYATQLEAFQKTWAPGTKYYNDTKQKYLDAVQNKTLRDSSMGGNPFENQAKFAAEQAAQKEFSLQQKYGMSSDEWSDKVKQDIANQQIRENMAELKRRKEQSEPWYGSGYDKEGYAAFQKANKAKEEKANAAQFQLEEQQRAAQLKSENDARAAQLQLENQQRAQQAAMEEQQRKTLEEQQKAQQEAQQQTVDNNQVFQDQNTYQPTIQANPSQPNKPVSVNSPEYINASLPTLQPPQKPAKIGVVQKNYRML